MLFRDPLLSHHRHTHRRHTTHRDTTPAPPLPQAIPHSPPHLSPTKRGGSRNYPVGLVSPASQWFEEWSKHLELMWKSTRLSGRRSSRMSTRNAVEALTNYHSVCVCVSSSINYAVQIYYLNLYCAVVPENLLSHIHKHVYLLILSIIWFLIKSFIYQGF